MEEEAGLRDPRVPVNERDLTEAASALVGVELSPHRLGARGGGDVGDAPCAERDLQAFDHQAADDHRFGQADHAVGAAPVGAREDLLSRNIRHVRDAIRVAQRAAGPSSVRHQPDRQIRIRAVVAHLGQVQSVQRAGSGGQFRGALPPAGDRIGLVEAHRRRDRFPEAFQIWFAEDLLRPPRIGRRDHRPAQLLPDDRLPVGPGLFERERGRLRRIDIVEQVRVRIADERDADAPLGRPRPGLLNHPRACPGQPLDVRVGELRAPDRAV